MFSYAGNYHVLTILGCVLSGISTILSMLPFVCIWLVIRDLIQAFAAGDISLATESTRYAWIAVVFAAASILIYFIALNCTHLAAFRTATNMRKQQFIILWHCRWAISAKMPVDGCGKSLMIMQGLQKGSWPISSRIWPVQPSCRLRLLFWFSSLTGGWEFAVWYLWESASSFETDDGWR